MVYGTQNYHDCQRAPIQGLEQHHVFLLLLTAITLIGTIAGIWGAF